MGLLSAIARTLFLALILFLDVNHAVIPREENRLEGRLENAYLGYQEQTRDGSPVSDHPNGGKVRSVLYLVQG